MNANSPVEPDSGADETAAQDGLEDVTRAAPDDGGVVLFVDDETNILHALRRLFRGSGHRVLLAENAEIAFEYLEDEPVDLVVSDMRMPGMDGAAFLEKVRERWPDVVRILLTGFSDVALTIQAINRGEIYRYVSKPWDDNDLRLIVRHAIETRRLALENRRLVEVTQRQNRLLKDLNTSLEARVAQRTEELRGAMEQLQSTHGKLKKSFIDSVHVLSGLIEMREGRLGGHSRRVAELAHAIANDLGLEESDAQDVMLAGLLHDLGKIGLPDDMLRKPELELSDPERAIVRKHPVTGELALMAVEQLQEAARIIRHHHERFDGQGYPDGLKGEAIPLGARILAVVNDFDAVQHGDHFKRKYSQSEAREYIVEGRGSRYDPRVVRSLLRHWTAEQEAHASRAQGKARGAAILRGDIEADATDSAAGMTGDGPVEALRPRSLRTGMVLARDLIHIDGFLLLSRGYVVDERVITRLTRLEKSLGMPMTVLIDPASIEPGG
ncbi:MAG: response regulator [Azoarcus sp.]|nr:response regulator [Azoarcus sp.]